MKVTKRQKTTYLEDIDIGQVFKLTDERGNCSYYIKCKIVREDGVAVSAIFDIDDATVYFLRPEDMNRQVIPLYNAEIII